MFLLLTLLLLLCPDLVLLLLPRPLPLLLAPTPLLHCIIVLHTAKAPIPIHVTLAITHLPSLLLLDILLLLLPLQLPQ
jgi:hypothetical protein